MASVGEARSGVADPFEDLAIASLESWILELDDIVARTTAAIERCREGGGNRVVERHGVRDRGAVEADSIECRRERRHALGAGRLGTRPEGCDATIGSRPVDRGNRLRAQCKRYSASGNRGGRAAR